MRITRTANILAVTAVIATFATAGTAGAAAGRTCTWELVDVDNAPQDVLLQSVSVLSTKDVRVVGLQDNIGTWTGHWDGRSAKAATQLPGIPFETVMLPGAVDYDPTGSGWTLFSGSVRGQTATNTARWHDGRWTVVQPAPSPDPLTTGTALAALEALAPDDAWAAGRSYLAQEGVVAGVQPTGALLEHWDGQQWRIVDNPMSSADGAYLNDIKAIAANNLWAVGGQWNEERQQTVPLVLHYDGTAWQVLPTPAGQAPSALYAVHGSGPDDVWAVGAQTRTGTNLAVPLVLHYDGTAWSLVDDLPDVGNSRLEGVYAISPDNVWATGLFPVGSEQAAFLHWDGTSWTARPLPGPAQYGLHHLYQDIDGTDGDVWAVGGSLDRTTLDVTPRIAHLDCGRR